MPSAAASGPFTIAGDLDVNRLGYGAMRITGKGIWGPPEDLDNARAVLRRAVGLGVNFIDTADSYGPDVSEELIADALYPYPDGMVIATKGGFRRPGPGKWSANGRPEYLRAACEGSLRRLRLERIDLYQLHTPDRDVPYEESLGALGELRDEGKIRHVGVSNVTLEQLEQARSIVEVTTVQNRYSLGDRGAQDVLDHCEAEGVGFIPWFPLGAGQLADAGVLRELAERHEASPFQIALAWLLHVSTVTLPIPGTKSLEHLEENVAAAEIALTEDEVAQLSAIAD